MSNRDQNIQLDRIEKKVDTMLSRQVAMERNLRSDHEAIYRTTAFGKLNIAWNGMTEKLSQTWNRFSAWFKTAILRKGVGGPEVKV